METNWVELVVVPFMIALIIIGWMYLRNPRSPDLQDTRRFFWSAVASGVVWAVIRSFAAMRTAAGFTAEPIISGVMLILSTLIIRFVLLRIDASVRARRHKDESSK